MTVLNVNEGGGTWNVGVSLQALPPLLSLIPSPRAGYAGYDATGESNQNLKTQGKLNMCSLESHNPSSSLDHNLYSFPLLVPLSLFSPQKKHRRLFSTIICSPSTRHYRFAITRNLNAPSNAM